MKLEKGQVIQAWDGRAKYPGGWRRMGVISGIGDGKVKMYQSSSPKGYRHYEWQLADVLRWLADGTFRIRPSVPDYYLSNEIVLSP